MASLTPEIDAYQQAQNFGLRQSLGTLQQAGQVASLAAALRKIAMDDRMRSELDALGANGTQEARASIAARYAGPEALLADASRKATRENTKEMALARLQQTATIAEQNFALRWKNATTAAEKAQVEAQWKNWRSMIEAERLKYDTGAKVAPFQWSPMPSETQAKAPTYADALARVMANGGTVEYPEATGPAFPQPAGTPQPSGVTPAPAAPVAPPVGAPDASAWTPQVSTAPAAPDNLDARDLRLRAMGQAGAPAAAPKAVSTMPPEIASAPQKVQDAWRLQQTKPSISGAAQLTPQALKMVAQQYLSGDNTAVQGYARNTATRVAITNAITEEATARGMSGEDIAKKVAEFQGIKAGQRSLGTRGALIQIAAKEAHEMADIVLETSQKFERTNFVPWNRAIVAYERNIGSPEVREFGAAINTFVNAYARAVNPTGVGTVSDKDHARELLSTIDSPQQVQSVIGILKREMEIAVRAPGQVREEMRNEGKAGSAGAWRVIR